MTISSPSLTPSSSSSNPSNQPTWWESISKARASIHSLSAILPSDLSLFPLADSERPALSLLHSQAAFEVVSAALSLENSGAIDDPFCHWLYDTFQSSDPDLCLVVLSYLPPIAGLYLSRVVQSWPIPSLAGFEAVLLALYSSEVKLRNGRPITITVPNLSQSSLYHVPMNPAVESSTTTAVLSEPLEPQISVKSTKRACIVAAAFECYYRKISHMPSWSKLSFCEFAASWAGKDCSCSCPHEFDSRTDSTHELECDSRASRDDDGSVEEGMRKLEIQENCASFAESEADNKNSRGSRIPLPWELLQPVLRILGHCLLAPTRSQDVRDAASVAVRHLYARAMHDLVPRAILATRSLIQLDKRAQASVSGAPAALASIPSTPSKPKKPEILLMPK